jgi:hypothetical protein
MLKYELKIIEKKLANSWSHRKLDPCGQILDRVSLNISISMPYDLVLLPVMCDSVNTSANAISSRNLLFLNSFSHLEVLVVIEEVRGLLAILHGHKVV